MVKVSEALNSQAEIPNHDSVGEVAAVSADNASVDAYMQGVDKARQLVDSVDTQDYVPINPIEVGPEPVLSEREKAMKSVDKYRKVPEPSTMDRLIALQQERYGDE